MDQCETQTYHFRDDGSIPNNRLPLVVYRQCLDVSENQARTTLESNGWGKVWVNGIYGYHHYHSTAHECLVVLEGTATLMLGGDDGQVMDVTKGDVLILPAGTGHKCLTSSGSFKVMGAYPAGQTYDMQTGSDSERPAVLENIARVPLPEKDPVYGAAGTLLRVWAPD